MGRQCQVCIDQTRPLIESGLALGESFASLSERTGLTVDSIRRHAKRHLRRVSADGDDLEKQIAVWLERIDRLYHAAGSTGDLRSQIECIKSAMSLMAERQALLDKKTKQQEAKKLSDGGPSLEWIDDLMRSIHADELNGQPTESIPEPVIE